MIFGGLQLDRYSDMLKRPYNSSGRRKKWIIMDGLRWYLQDPLLCFLPLGVLYLQDRLELQPCPEFDILLAHSLQVERLRRGYYIQSFLNIFDNHSPLNCVAISPINFTLFIYCVCSMQLKKNIVHNSLTVYLIYFKVEIVLKQHNGQTDTI